MYHKSNINYLIDEKDKKEKITRSLKTLYYDTSPLVSKLAAIKYLGPILNTDPDLKEKFEFFYHKETDFYLRQKMASFLGINQDSDLI
jgi:hypothetical protein